MTSNTFRHPDFEAAASALVAVGRDFHARGWALATGGNFSMRLGDGGMVITASGREKDALTVDDVVALDVEGRLVSSSGSSGPEVRGLPRPTFNAASSRARPSAETTLHAKLYARLPQVGAVLHVHSPCATVISQLDAATGMIELTGYEMLKALSEVRTHEHKERVPIFANTQNMAVLARDVDAWMDAFGTDNLHGYLVAGHGLYAWGRHIREARRHVEAFEFLFDCTLRHRAVASPARSAP
ncbi:MAG TPA: methylthioribulose 1-phosphate dehydratase [Polyangiaceae bacterium]|nr:methylthioribulose 1-phosphate dehydratase [Polyangiaceae bacterium]